MKKIMTTIGIFMLFAFAACGGPWFGLNYVYDDADKYTMGNGSIAESVQNLKIDWVCGEVNVVYHDEETVDFSEESRATLTDEKTMYYRFENGTLFIQFAKSGSYNWNPPEKELTVSLPRDVVLESFEADTASADVTAESLSAKYLDIDTVSGRVKIDALSCAESVKADTTSGGVDISLSGDVRKADISTVSGTVNVKAEKITEFDCESTSGSITLSAKTAPSSIDIDSVSGKVTLYLPKDLNATLEFDTVSGDFNCAISCSVSGKDTYSFGAGTGRYTVDTTSGNLKIEEYE